MSHRWVAFAFVLSTFLGAPSRGAAQAKAPDETAPSADAIKRAEALFNQGVRLYSRTDWRGAEAAFRAAWALNPTFDVAYNLGSAEYQLKKYPEAAEHLAYALRHFPLIGAVASLRTTAQQRLRDAQAMIGTLTVTVSVSGAEVLVDGKPVGKAPLEGELFVAPGKHRVEARLAGYETASRQLQAWKGSAETVALVLPASRPPVNATPPEVANPAQQPAGRSKRPMLAKGSRAPIEPPAEPRSAVPAIVLGGVAVAGLAGGITFTVMSNRARSESHRLQSQIDAAGARCGADADPATCRELSDALSRTDTFRSLAVGGFIGAGAGAIAATTYLLWPASRAGVSGGVRFAPVASPGGGGIVALGSF
jgi:hypothetical protein